jgi:hypothetical protein
MTLAGLARKAVLVALAASIPLEVSAVLVESMASAALAALEYAVC